MDNKNLPAYPQPITIGSGGDIIVSWEKHTDWGGLTKRERIAAMCLQGLMYSVTPTDVTYTSRIELLTPLFKQQINY